MAQEETILLHFDIDEQPAVNSIKDLRAANSQLRAERDKVNISTKEGQQLVQQLNVAIDKNNKLIKDNSSALEKQRQNVGNYSKSIEEAAGNLNVMGTNVGSLGKSISVGNPYILAATGLLTALGAAYARSANGAKDLEFVSNQLGAAFGLLSNDLATLVGASGEDGEGLLTKFTNFMLRTSIIGITDRLGFTDIIEGSKEAALALERLEDLVREEIGVRAVSSDRLADNQEILSKIQDSQTDYNEKLHLTGEITSNITKNEDELVAVKQKQIAELEEQRKSAKNVEAIDTKILEIGRDIANVQKDAERKRQGIVRLESNLLDQENKRLDTINKQNQALANQTAEIQRAKRIRDLDEQLAGKKEGVDLDGELETIIAIDLDKHVEGVFKKTEDRRKATEEKNREQIAKTTQFEKEQLQNRLDFATTISGQALALFEENTIAYKIIATADAIANTYKAANLALGSYPPPASYALAAISVAAGLANVARIQGASFAEGGYTGSGGKYQPAGIVHKGEYVAPQHIVKSPSAQPHIAALENMRLKGYADGGFVANTNMQVSNQALIMANAMKNLPPVFASWVEGRAVGRRVEFKERVSKQ